jgi:type I restriction enzyme R subunit
MKFTESQLERAFIELLGKEGIPHLAGDAIPRPGDEVLIKDDLRAYLQKRYGDEGITTGEINSIIRNLEKLPASDLYESN